MRAILFQTGKIFGYPQYAMVEIDPRSHKIGGSWQGDPRCIWTGGGIVCTPVAHESETIKFFAEKAQKIPFPHVVDAGANTGNYCLLGTINHDMTCYAFEPVPSTYEILIENIKLNNLQDRVKTFQVALSDTEGTTILKIPTTGFDSGFSCMSKKPTRFHEWTEISAPMRRLDEIEEIEKLDLLKIDVEGHELYVLKGAEKLIKQYHPGVLVEYSIENTRQFGYNPVEIRKLLESWGYDNYEITKSGDLYFDWK